MTRLARYQPPSISPQLLVALVVTSALLCFVWGLDYTVGQDEGSQSLVVLEALGNIKLWGVAMMATAAGVLTSYALQKHFLIWLSHVVMAALYVCVSVTVAQSSWLAGDGWAAVVPPASTLLWHLVLLTVTRPFPRPGAGHDT